MTFSTLPLPMLLAGTAFIGLMVGSFLNVVIHRLPRMLERQWALERATPTDALAHPSATYNLATPRSACPHCHTPIKALHNVPILSWLLLRGRCASCQAPISVRYPLVELGTMLLSLAVIWRFGASHEAICGLLLTWSLIALAGIDLDTQLLPDQITLPLLWAGLIAAAWLGHGPAPLPVDLKSAVLGAAAGYLSLWSIFQLFRLVTGKDGMGYGDFKLLAALGAWFGWQMLLPILLFAAGAGALVGLLLIALRRHERQVPIPFGPYLAAAGWLIMMASHVLVTPWWSFAH